MTARPSVAQAEPEPEGKQRGGLGAPRGTSAAVGLAVALLVGVVAGLASSVPGTWRQGLLVGWIAGAAVYLNWVWWTVGRLDEQQTAAYAVREDPSAELTDIMILVSAVASLVAVGLLLAGGSSHLPGGKFGQAALTVISVATAWGVIHSNYALRYARLYYTKPEGGIDFNEDEPPRYTDFAYLAFTIGMTFQVSDTDLKTKRIRATALRHALVSFFFGAVIIATVINLVAGLSK